MSVEDNLGKEFERAVVGGKPQSWHLEVGLFS
jgi:hypothetical protein